MLVYPTYFSPIIQYVAMAQADSIVFEVEDNYQKQTYRTRCYIYGANGKQLLNIPIKNANSKQKTKDVLVDNSFPWLQQHLKSITSAYRSSPYFEFYEDEIMLLFNKQYKYLIDFNFSALEFIFESLSMDMNFEKTTTYEKTPKDQLDLRLLENAKSVKDYKLIPYIQVFESKHKFIPNLSIIDLLCSEGPNALHYLEQQKIDFSTL